MKRIAFLLTLAACLLLSGCYTSMGANPFSVSGHWSSADPVIEADSNLDDYMIWKGERIPISFVTWEDFDQCMVHAYRVDTEFRHSEEYFQGYYHYDWRGNLVVDITSTPEQSIFGGEVTQIVMSPTK